MPDDHQQPGDEDWLQERDATSPRLRDLTSLRSPLAALRGSWAVRVLWQVTPAVLIALIAGLLVAGYVSTQTVITLSVDGAAYPLGTHQTTVAAVLRDAAVTLEPEDLVSPPPDTLVTPGLRVDVQHAQHVTVQVDGRVLETRTRERAPLTILARLGVQVGMADRVIVDGRELGAGRSFSGGGSLLAAAALVPGTGAPPEDKDQPPPDLIEVRRAVQITVLDAGARMSIQTLQPTVGQALHKAGIVLYLGDSVQPPLWTRVSNGLTVEIRRSVPVNITSDGHTLHTRTFRGSVGEVLADTGIALVGQDYSLPAPTSAITAGMSVQVVRVRDEVLTEQESIAYASVWQGDPTLEIDHQRVNQTGDNGVRQRRTRVRYENGIEVSRALEDEWVVKEPTTQINAYGTQIIVRTLDTPEGTVEYWRVMPMLATSYSASTAGTPRSSPWYGRTAVGWPMRRGIIAVDPNVIPLFTQLYVPGYGTGIAADTGSAIKNRRLDLGYDDDNLVLWYSWVQCYILTPVPDPSRIQYVLGGLTNP